MTDDIDRKAVRIARIDQVGSDYAFWKDQPNERRLSTVEEIRREYHGWGSDERPYFSEFIKLMNVHGVRYVVVGGYAVAFHGHPRYTKDIDIWIEPQVDNARKLLAVLEEFGFGDVGLVETDFLKSDQVVQLGRPPNRIDLLTSVHGVDFPTSFANKVTADIAGVSVHFIGLEELRQNKRAVGRHQDLADLENLEEAV